jgi:cytochrome b
MATTLIWPWWVRLSHWLVAFGIIALWLMAYGLHETGKSHSVIGYALLVIVGARMLAGFLSRIETARLAWSSWQQIQHHWVHLKQGRLPVQHGHNPLGQLAVYALWACVSLLSVTGYLSRTDWLWGEDWPVSLHAGLSVLLLLLVVLHVLAVLLVSKLARQHLLLQMWHGKQQLYHNKKNRV